MGCPDRYYKKALQYFAYSLLYMKNTILANMWLKENDIRKLEEFILEKKKDCNEKHFYYIAGQETNVILKEAAEEGCDDFNACAGGIYRFERFISLEEEENE